MAAKRQLSLLESWNQDPESSIVDGEPAEVESRSSSLSPSDTDLNVVIPITVANDSRGENETTMNSSKNSVSVRSTNLLDIAIRKERPLKLILMMMKSTTN